jgi:hypothetical protein
MEDEAGILRDRARDRSSYEREGQRRWARCKKRKGEQMGAEFEPKQAVGAKAGPNGWVPRIIIPQKKKIIKEK